MIARRENDERGVDQKIPRFSLLLPHGQWLSTVACSGPRVTRYMYMSCRHASLHHRRRFTEWVQEIQFDGITAQISVEFLFGYQFLIITWT